MRVNFDDNLGRLSKQMEQSSSSSSGWWLLSMIGFFFHFFEFSDTITENTVTCDLELAVVLFANVRSVISFVFFVGWQNFLDILFIQLNKN